MNKLRNETCICGDPNGCESCSCRYCGNLTTTFEEFDVCDECLHRDEEEIEDDK